MNGSSPERSREVVLSSTDATDRISQLPRPILHHILSFLETKDVVRTGILSKTWYQTSTSFPVSDFCQSLVGEDPQGLVTKEERIHIFVEFVRKSLQNQSRTYGTIPKFSLSMNQPSPHPSIIEDCIQLAVQNNVKHLEIELMQREDRLIMPQTLLYAKGLILLTLHDCHLSLPPTHGVPTWPSLRKLCLQNCHIDGIFWKNLTFSCPLLEFLHLSSCDELRDISLSGLTKLSEVDIVSINDIMVELLDVPCLQSFYLYSFRGRCNVDLTACKNLRILKLKQMREPMLSSQDLTKLTAGLPALKSLTLRRGSDRIRFSGQLLEELHLNADEIAETDLADLIAGLPALKFLFLQCKCERIKFSSQQLEDLVLSVSEVVEVSIDAPNLKTFYCSNNVLSSDIFTGRPSLQEVIIIMLYGSALSFLELRKFLGGFKQIKILQLWLSRHNRLLPEEWMDIPDHVLPDIKHLRIAAGVGWRTLSREDCVSLLNGLLRSCLPESISFDFGPHGQFMAKVFLEELVKGQQHCCMDDDLKS